MCSELACSTRVRHADAARRSPRGALRCAARTQRVRQRQLRQRRARCGPEQLQPCVPGSAAFNSHSPLHLRSRCFPLVCVALATPSFTRCRHKHVQLNGVDSATAVRERVSAACSRSACCTGRACAAVGLRRTWRATRSARAACWPHAPHAPRRPARRAARAAPRPPPPAPGAAAAATARAGCTPGRGARQGEQPSPMTEQLRVTHVMRTVGHHGRGQGARMAVCSPLGSQPVPH